MDLEISISFSLMEDQFEYVDNHPSKANPASDTAGHYAQPKDCEPEAFAH
jgi:hypothetical protein